MNLLQLQKAFKHFGEKSIFNGASVTVNEGEHIGVIGPNGAGKTTLFKILVGQETLDQGETIRSQSLRVGYLEQESEWGLEDLAEEYLSHNCVKPLWELKKLGLELGLKQSHFQSPLKNLSGGYRMRMKLLYLIGQEPNLMLLDEPTNFLDLESILALENFLLDYKGAFLLISHDREFLRRTTESTVEVEDGEITKFPGNIDDYFEQKTQLQEILQAQAANLEAKRAHIQSFVDRFRSKATKAKQAQSRIKQLDKMENIEVKALPVRAKINLPPVIHTGKETLKIESAQLGYGNTIILKNVNLRLERGHRLGVVGFNGAGKSTLLKSLAGRLPLLGGTCSFGYQVELSYFAQHIAEELDPNKTVLDCLQQKAHPDIKAQEILNMAGSLLFSGASVQKKIKVLSGGEKSRVALGQMLLQKNPLLIMDEPTNHLDFDTVEALTEALGHFDGTLIVVSHDRGFISRVANKILEIRDGRVEMYPGTYDDYVWSLEKGSLKTITAAATEEDLVQTLNTTISIEKNEKFNYKETTKKIQTEIKELERKIQAHEKDLKTSEARREAVHHELILAKGLEAQNLAKESSQLSIKIDSCEMEILSSMEILESKENQLKELRDNSRKF